MKNGINARYVLSVDSAKGFLEGYEVDLVLSDLRLNNSNGVELLEWMKAQGYRMPFLIMTGYGDILSAVEADEERCRRLSTKTCSDGKGTWYYPWAVGLWK